MKKLLFQIFIYSFSFFSLYLISLYTCEIGNKNSLFNIKSKVPYPITLLIYKDYRNQTNNSMVLSNQIIIQQSFEQKFMTQYKFGSDNIYSFPLRLREKIPNENLNFEKFNFC